MKKRAKQPVCFAVCINNKRYEASLEAGKLYRVIPDEEAESDRTPVHRYRGFPRKAAAADARRRADHVEGKGGGIN